MTYASFIFAVFAAVAGAVAARKWHEASKVDFRPFDDYGNQLSEDHTREWIRSIRLTLNKAGPLNRNAAIWTAVAALSAGLSALANALAG